MNTGIQQSHYLSRSIAGLLCGTVSLCLVCGSCKKFVEIPPPKTQITNASVFTDDATATAAITGIYSRMMASTGFGSGNFYGLSALAGLSADELVNYSPGLNNEFYNNNLSAANGLLSNSLWSEPYQYIYSANNIIEGLSGSNTLTAEIRNELTGEAKFIRAFCYFYLVNLYGAVPLDTVTDYRANAIRYRNSEDGIYQQIIADLSGAEQLLPVDYSSYQNERTRPNKWAAMALMARVYLYRQNWEAAANESSELINNVSLYQLVSLDSVFLKNSSEAIWQLAPVIPGFNTNEGQLFVLSVSPVWYSMSKQLFSAFEGSDQRGLQWVGSLVVAPDTFYYPSKYKIASGSDVQEYSMVLRLGEQFLIRAEARLWLGDLTGAAADLNQIRNRAGLPNTTATDKNSLLAVILRERQVELFTEWGHRWLDLKRTRQAGPILSGIKQGWNDTDSLYPIPQIEIQNNSRITQNTGY